jgi:hypothetical protein
MTAKAILIIVAIVCFVAAALGAKVSDLNLVAIGLAFFAGSFLA